MGTDPRGERHTSLSDTCNMFWRVTVGTARSRARFLGRQRVVLANGDCVGTVEDGIGPGHAYVIGKNGENLLNRCCAVGHEFTAR